MLKTAIKNKQNLEGGIMKYKQLKPISKKAIYEAQQDKKCDDFWAEYGKFQHRYSESAVHSTIPVVNEDGTICAPFIDHQVWIDYLIQHEFIEEIKERTYHKGQRFKTDGLGHSYILAAASESRGQLTNLSTGDYRTEPVKIESINAVTSKELDMLASYGKWELIE